MNFPASVSLLLSLVFSVLLGAQTRSWSWGPALLALAVSLGCSIPLMGKKGKLPETGNMTLLLCVTVAWFCWRAAVSPVREFAYADMMLLAAAFGAYITTQQILASRKAETAFIWGLAILGAANLVVIGIQMADPGFSAIFSNRPVSYPSGFFSHYNEGANFLIGTSFLLAGTACFGRHHPIGRIALGLVAILGLIAVYYTRSRGAILAVALGAAAFSILALIHGKRQKSKWFAPFIILAPILAIIGFGLFLKGWADTQEFRFAEKVGTVMDNPTRLSLLGAAFSSILSHPMLGGGSRSFSWECYQFWNAQDGASGRPEWVHNELLQAATDYGLIGAALIMIIMTIVILSAVIRSCFAKKTPTFLPIDGWRAGGAAALVGMFCQSSFSFVFHLLPGAILLGVCAAHASTTSKSTPPVVEHPPYRIMRAIFTVPTVLCGVFLLITGWITTRQGIQLFPIYLKSTRSNYDSAILERYQKAIDLWPQAAFHREKAFIYQKWIVQENSELTSSQAMSAAIEEYQKASDLNSKDVTLTLNLANLLSAAQRNEEADRAYEKSIEQQGEMEHGFHVRLQYAGHLLKRGTRQLSVNQIPEALSTFSDAIAQLDAIQSTVSQELTQSEGANLKAHIYEGLGLAYELTGDYKGALEAFEVMASADDKTGGSYRIAALQSKMAREYWTQRRPAEALALFLRAKERMAKNPQLPANVNLEKKIELREYIDQSILFLQKARITPSPIGE